MKCPAGYGPLKCALQLPMLFGSGLLRGGQNLDLGKDYCAVKRGPWDGSPRPPEAKAMRRLSKKASPAIEVKKKNALPG